MNDHQHRLLVKYFLLNSFDIFNFSKVADLFAKLFSLHRESVKNNEEMLEDWSVIWWKPVIKCIESNYKSRKLYTFEVTLRIFVILIKLILF